MSCSDDLGVVHLQMKLALNAFEHFLSADKGLSMTTRECYFRHVQPFLAEVCRRRLKTNPVSTGEF